ncbi:MAG: hypothetical protein FWH03_04510 [Firmicutes bacterium]|nr:hypothetical protein [Bacillota bacterium]
MEKAEKVKLYDTLPRAEKKALRKEYGAKSSSYRAWYVCIVIFFVILAAGYAAFFTHEIIRLFTKQNISWLLTTIFHVTAVSGVLPVCMFANKPNHRFHAWLLKEKGIKKVNQTAETPQQSKEKEKAYRKEYRAARPREKLWLAVMLVLMLVGITLIFLFGGYYVAVVFSDRSSIPRITTIYVPTAILSLSAVVKIGLWSDNKYQLWLIAEKKVGLDEGEEAAKKFPS